MPKGEEMTRKLSSLLADNSARFGYSGAVVKSLKMELHAVSERIRCEFNFTFRYAPPWFATAENIYWLGKLTRWG